MASRINGDVIGDAVSIAGHRSGAIAFFDTIVRCARGTQSANSL